MVVDETTPGRDLSVARGPRTPRVDGAALCRRLQTAWERTDALLALVTDTELLLAPVPGLPPLLFHVGHLASVAASTLGAAVPLDPELDALFRRPAEEVGCVSSRRWPRREQVEAHRDGVRAALTAWLVDLPAQDAPEAAVEEVLLHEVLHQEQLLGVLQHVPGSAKRAPPNLPRPSFGTASVRRLAPVPAGEVPACVLGPDAVPVPAFRMGTTPVITGELFEFFTEGGYDDPLHWRPDDWAWRREVGLDHPRAWRRVGDQWLLRGVFEDLPLDRVFDWPASVSLAEARAWTSWRGLRLPTEAQLLRAIHATPAGGWRPFPWGDEEPEPRHGNFGRSHWSPTPVGSHPAGVNAFGHHELLGNGWEWVDDPDGGSRGRLRGASWASDPLVLRRGFRRRSDPRCAILFSKFRPVEPT